MKLGEPAVGPLIEALDDRNINIACGATIRESLAVQENAAEALGNIGDERAVEPLIKVLKYGNSGVKERAAKALEKIKAKKS